MLDAGINVCLGTDGASSNNNLNIFEEMHLAAMICLEGFSISSDALFFLEPRLATSSWIPKNRKYLFSILHHDFYA